MNRHVVEIMPTDVLWRYDRFDNDLLTPMIRDWMDENIACDWTWQHEYVGGPKASPFDKGWRLVFRFRCETDAINFKLRWV